MAKKLKKLPYIDYECIVGERVIWRNLQGETFEGVLEEWDNGTALIKKDDGTIEAIEC